MHPKLRQTLNRPADQSRVAAGYHGDNGTVTLLNNHGSMSSTTARTSYALMSITDNLGVDVPITSTLHEETKNTQKKSKLPTQKQL